jgi:transmembrane sensor
VQRAGGMDASVVVDTEPIFVTAGGRVEIPADVSQAPKVAPTAMSAAEMAAALAWRGRRVEFTHTTLGEAVALFNGQNAVQIVLADAAVGRVAISGIFWADDPEGFVRLLEAGFALQAERAGQRITLRSR